MVPVLNAEPLPTSLAIKLDQRFVLAGFLSFTVHTRRGSLSLRAHLIRQVWLAPGHDVIINSAVLRLLSCFEMTVRLHSGHYVRQGAPVDYLTVVRCL